MQQGLRRWLNNKAPMGPSSIPTSHLKNGAVSRAYSSGSGKTGRQKLGDHSTHPSLTWEPWVPEEDLYLKRQGMRLLRNHTRGWLASGKPGPWATKITGNPILRVRQCRPCLCRSGSVWCVVSRPALGRPAFLTHQQCALPRVSTHMLCP